MTYGIVFKKAPQIDLNQWLKDNQLTLEVLEYGSACFRATLTPSINLSVRKHFIGYKEWTANTLEDLLTPFCRNLSAAESIHYNDLDNKNKLVQIPVGVEVTWSEPVTTTDEGTSRI